MAETVLEGMLSMDSGERVVFLPGVADVAAAMQRFGWHDYLMFVAMLLICVGVGVFFGLVRHQDVQQLTVGGRNMPMAPVAVSLIASFISGISILGIPTEIYLFGIQYTFVLLGVGIMAVIFNKVFLPVIYNLNLTSTYEYHERRFGRSVRLFASFLYTLQSILYLPIVIYVPALAFNQVTGINVHYITPIVCISCIFYTAMGGLRAVVWTDVIQTSIMFGAMVVVAVKGTVNLGGFGHIWQRNTETGRIEGPNFDPDPLSRHTIWSLAIGSCFYFLQDGALNQTMIQRYLSLPSLKQAKRASWCYFWGMCAVVLLCAYCGLLMFATYHECDPLTTMLAREKDQMLPLLVMDVLRDWPGLLGIFIAGILSASLSSLSSGLNSMAVVILEDFVKLGLNKSPDEQQSSTIIKLSVVVFGLISLALVFVVEKLGMVLQLTMSVGTIASGPSLALFTMGVLLPWIKSTSALIGAGCSLVVMAWIALRAQFAYISGEIIFSGKPVTTHGCHYRFTPAVNVHFNASAPAGGEHSDIFMLFRLSYLWYTLSGLVVAVAVASTVSFLTETSDPRDVDPALLAPCVRRLIKPRKYPNQPDDGIIYAYNNEQQQQSENNKNNLDCPTFIPLKMETNMKQEIP